MESENGKSPLLRICEEEQAIAGGSENGGAIRLGAAILEEAKKQIWLAGPLVCVNVLQYSLQLISIMFVGHVGELPLSGAAVATSFATVTGFSLLLGMSTALETFCGQSYGAKQYHMLSIHMQRAMLVLTLVSAPLAVIWAYTGPILEAVGQEQDISEAAGDYAQVMIPSLFAYGILQCLIRFLQTQNIVFPMMITSAITALLHLPLCWSLVFKSGLGYRGAALASSISNWINVLLLALYVKFSSSCAKSWTGFSKEALHEILAFVKLAVPSAVMVFVCVLNVFSMISHSLEMWSFKMLFLASGFLPNPTLQTSVLSICLNTSALCWMISLGLSGAISTRVSNELGAGRPQAARLAVCVVLAIAIADGVLVGAVLILILILIRNVWEYAYSGKTEVIKYVATMLPFLAASNFLDGLQCVLSGNARGCGWQKTGACVNLGAYYLVGLPSAIVFAFVLHVEGEGLWLGIICALSVQSVLLLTITIRTNWEKEAKKATERIYDATMPLGRLYHESA